MATDKAEFDQFTAGRGAGPRNGRLLMEVIARRPHSWHEMLKSGQKMEDSVVLNKLSTLPLLAFIMLIEPVGAIAQEATQPRSLPPPEWYWHGPWHGSSFWWICPLMFLFMLCVFGAFFVFGRRHHWVPPWHMMERGWRPASHSALQILNERFARGEIEKDEYEERKAAILSGGH